VRRSVQENNHYCAMPRNRHPCTHSFQHDYPYFQSSQSLVDKMPSYTVHPNLFLLSTSLDLEIKVLRNALEADRFITSYSIEKSSLHLHRSANALNRLKQIAASPSTEIPLTAWLASLLQSLSKKYSLIFYTTIDKHLCTPLSTPLQSFNNPICILYHTKSRFYSLGYECSQKGSSYTEPCGISSYPVIFSTVGCDPQPHLPNMISLIQQHSFIPFSLKKMSSYKKRQGSDGICFYDSAVKVNYEIEKIVLNSSVELYLCCIRKGDCGVDGREL